MPYQLQISPLAIDDGVLERLDELGAIDEGIEDELGATLERTELDAEVVVPLQPVPDTVGRSAEPPFFSPCKPKETDWPTAILPFQDTLVAV